MMIKKCNAGCFKFVNTGSHAAFCAREIRGQTVQKLPMNIHNHLVLLRQPSRWLTIKVFQFHIWFICTQAKYHLKTHPFTSNNIIKVFLCKFLKSKVNHLYIYFYLYICIFQMYKYIQISLNWQWGQRVRVWCTLSCSPLTFEHLSCFGPS